MMMELGDLLDDQTCNKYQNGLVAEFSHSEAPIPGDAAGVEDDGRRNNTGQGSMYPSTPYAISISDQITPDHLTV
nr:hypothetical protein CFP56_11530 [Quercus suber]